MLETKVKKLFAFFILAVNFGVTFAQGCSDLEDPSTARGLACVIGAIITIVFGIVIAVFTAFIAYGAVKLAMAQGDPKGYAGAVSTWQHALIGFFIVFAILGVLSIISRLMGIDVLDINSMVSQFSGGLDSLFEAIIQGDQ